MIIATIHYQSVATCQALVGSLHSLSNLHFNSPSISFNNPERLCRRLRVPQLISDV